MRPDQQQSSGNGKAADNREPDPAQAAASAYRFPTDAAAGVCSKAPLSIEQPLKLCIFGAALGTGNLGVSALSLSLLEGIARRVRFPQITTFDNSPGLRTDTVRLTDHDLTYQCCGVIPTRRLYHRDSLFRVRLAGRLGGISSPAIRAIREADAVIDVTGGDSFTDLYGPRRFRIVTGEKFITLEQNRPLILAPQTIGPFKSRRSRAIAQKLLRAAAMVWTRDQKSYTVLRELLGDDFDMDRHRCGVDLAFGLGSYVPTHPLPDPVEQWLSSERTNPLVGFNISGLIANNPEQSRRRFGLLADYRESVVRLLRRILKQTDSNILLVPHVSTRPNHFEHDADACESVAEELRQIDRNRVAVLPDGCDVFETKWIIARTDWFCGTRMHAAIAALTSGVPTAAIAYTRKTFGVFDTCQQGDHVADPRHLTTDDVVDHLWRCYVQREKTEADLQRALPTVHWQVESQMDDMLSCCLQHAQKQAPLRKAA